MQPLNPGGFQQQQQQGTHSASSSNAFQTSDFEHRRLYEAYTTDTQQQQQSQQYQQHQYNQQQHQRRDNLTMSDATPMMHRRNHSLGGQSGTVAGGAPSMQQQLMAAQQAAQAHVAQAQVNNSQQQQQRPRTGSSSTQDQNSLRRQSNSRGNAQAGQVAEELMPIAAPALTQPATHTVKASSTTSEFTKRKNWSQHIVDEIQDFMHVLSPTGEFIFVTPSIQDMAGWAVEELIGQPISNFVHKDDVEGYRNDFQQSLQDGKDLTLYCRFRTKENGYVLFEMTGHPYYNEVAGHQNCKCFFGMGRPYPSKNQAMLDSFLELKFENERLRQELQTLYKDIEGASGGDELLKSLGSRGESVIDPVTGLVQANGLLPSSSNTYGALGIGISTNPTTKSEGTEKKKKKPRVEEGEFVCRDCGTVDSPEWRKGPEGPKSLCNACGLRYAKLTSKAAKAAKAEREKKHA